jgi:hypothetical protein
MSTLCRDGRCQMTRDRCISLILLGLTAGCVLHRATPAATTAAEAPNDFGVLLMAHGGSPEWNAGVLATVAPLRDRYAIEVAFGMAEPTSIQEAVRRLEARGIRQIGVVRLQISGETWYDRTELILGLRPGRPERPASADRSHDTIHVDSGHSMELWRIETQASFALSGHGLAEAHGMGAVLADRARALSRDATRENVLILAHGPGDDSANERWIANIDRRAQAIRDALPFRTVQVMTLREDWPEKRAEAERRIRSVVSGAGGDSLMTIVIPFRVQGFGPYAQVLEGLDYLSDGQGLVPHPSVTQWIRAEINTMRRGPFRFPVCSTAASPNQGAQPTGGKG